MTIRPACAHTNCWPDSHDAIIFSLERTNRPFLSLCVPSCPLWLSPGFSGPARCRRLRAIPAMSAIPTALCRCPSATTPTPHRALLKTKAKVQFERPVKRLLKPFFYVFQQSNLAQFQPCFLVLTVRSAEGRTPYQVPMQRIYNKSLANCHLLNCQLLISKITAFTP